MSEEDLTNYKTYISDLDITKYIVLDKESNYWYSAEYVDKMLKKQDKEIERLNNIINEIYIFLSQYTITHTWQKIVIEDTIKYIDELKGVDKE